MQTMRRHVKRWRLCCDMTELKYLLLRIPMVDFNRVVLIPICPHIFCDTRAAHLDSSVSIVILALVK